MPLKILYLEHPEPDGGSTQLFMGLCRVLGDENVVDFPYKYCLHGQTEVLQNEDVKQFMKDNPDVFPNGGYSDPYEWSVPSKEWTMPSKSPEHHYEEIKKMIKNGEFDLVLMTPRLVSIYYFRRLLKDCNSSMPDAILCDFEDYHDIRYDLSKEFHPHIKVITKASLVPNNPGVFQNSITGMERIYPLPLSSPIIDHPKYVFDDSDENKTIDLHARFGLSRDLRKDVIDSMLKFNGSGSARTVVASLDQNIPYPEYLNEIAKSKISVSIGGHGLGRNPARNWEIPSYNTLLLCEKQAIYYEHPFEDGKTCVFFNPGIKDHVCEKAEYWLDESNDEARRKIAGAGNDHLKKYHTCKARAVRLIDIAKKEGLT